MAPFSCVLLYSQTTDVYLTKLQAGKRKNNGSPSLCRQWASPTDSQGVTYIKGEFVITLPSLILNVLVKTQISTSNRESHCLIHDTNLLILDYCNTLSYYRPLIQYENLVYLYFLHSHIIVLMFYSLNTGTHSYSV